MLLTGAVAQAPVVHQRGGAAAIQVEPVGRAEADKRVGQLDKSHTGISASAPVTGHRQQPITRERERSARIAPDRDVGVELVGTGRKSFRVDTLRDDAQALTYEY